MRTENYIGEWRSARGGRAVDRHNPADYREVVGSFAEADTADVDDAVSVARRAFPQWAATSIVERADVVARAAAFMRARSAEIGRVMSLEEGKPLAEGIGEVLRAAEVLDFSASFARRPFGAQLPSARAGAELRTLRRPLGVGGVITPFNFPAFIPCLKIGPGLVAGNCLIWKPSPETPLTGALIMAAFVEAGLPAGVLSYITGTSSELGEALVSHRGVDAITFTGSTAVGRRIELASVQSGKRVQLELGGVNPLVVLADADIERAATAAADGAFGGTGQKCTATRRVFVEGAVHDELLNRIRTRAAALRLGDGRADGVTLGPLVSERARVKVHAQVEALTGAGGVVVEGGRTPSGADVEHGWFYPPTIITDVPPASDLLDEEVFGPVLLVHAVKDLDDALDQIATSRFGLAAGIFSDSHRSIAAFTAAVDAGLISVNLATTGVEPQAPFGGLKDSGNGSKEVGQNALDFWTHEITVASAS